MKSLSASLQEFVSTKDVESAGIPFLLHSRRVLSNLTQAGVVWNSVVECVLFMQLQNMIKRGKGQLHLKSRGKC